MKKPHLEICADTLQACVAAREGGADRIELCSGLSEGGLTPSHAFIRRAMLESMLPVHVLLRPRTGDFVYAQSEFDVICGDLEHAAQLGAAGIVCGILRADRTVDIQRTSKLVQLADPMEVTFHRAFDLTPDLGQALEDVIGCGCQRVLSSGARPSAGEGESVLATLVQQTRGRIRIMAGGGITVQTAARLLACADVDLHASLRRRLNTDSNGSGEYVPGGESDLGLQVSDVRALTTVIATAVSAAGAGPPDRAQ
ncbi:MAG: copper homeostasis protein CutC [Acidobacteriaceae bacterium]|nr:copper homeostasis protein CutC [Acidobacteriaceae bacterium]